MTQNQVSFAKVKEEQRHNKATERLNKQQNKITQKHYQNQDEYTSAHYERSDQASMISANASAINADTGRKKYEMEYDIEYNWTRQPLTVSYYDPETGEKVPWTWDEKNGYQNSGTVVYNYPSGMPLSAQVKDAQAMSALYEAVNAPKKIELENAKTVSQTLQGGSSAVSNVFNALYGKQGLLGALQSIINEGE